MTATSWRRFPRVAGASLAVAASTLAILAFASAAFAPTALAAEDAAAAAAPSAPQGPGHVLAIVALGLLLLVGVGCMLAVLRACFPGLCGAVDRRARATGNGRAFLVGTLLCAGVALALHGAILSGSEPVKTVASLALGVPAALLGVLGALSVYPLLGERLLGARGANTTPLSRAIVGTTALGLGVAATSVSHLVPLAVLGWLAAVGWPLGVGFLTVIARRASSESDTGGFPDAAPEAPAR